MAGGRSCEVDFMTMAHGWSITSGGLSRECLECGGQGQPIVEILAPPDIAAERLRYPPALRSVQGF
jgi:hypothetical protein